MPGLRYSSFCVLYVVCQLLLAVNLVIKKFTSIQCNGKSLTKLAQPCIAFALWDSTLLGAPSSALQTSHPNAKQRPIAINYFASVT